MLRDKGRPGLCPLILCCNSCILSTVVLRIINVYQFNILNQHFHPVLSTYIYRHIPTSSNIPSPYFHLQLSRSSTSRFLLSIFVGYSMIFHGFLAVVTGVLSASTANSLAVTQSKEERQWLTMASIHLYPATSRARL